MGNTHFQLECKQIKTCRTGTNDKIYEICSLRIPHSSFLSWKIIAVLVASMTWSYWFMSAVSPEAFVETVNQLSSPVFSLVAMLDQLQFTHLIVVVAIHVGSLLLFWNRIRDRPIHR